MDGFRLAERLAEGGINLLLLDLSLPDSHGLDTFSKVQAQSPHVPVVVLTGLDDETAGLKAVQAGAQDYLVKSCVESNMLIRGMRYAIERHRLRSELEQTQKQQLELKDQFFSHVSHEVRSPLAAIHQFVTILLDGLAGDLNDEQREYLGIVLKNVKQLQTMISDLLEVTRADSGKLALDLRCVSLAESITETIGMLLTTAAVKGVQLSADVTGDLSPVCADPAPATRPGRAAEYHEERWG